MLFFLLNLVFQEEDVAAPDSGGAATGSAGARQQQLLHANVIARAARLHEIDANASLAKVCPALSWRCTYVLNGASSQAPQCCGDSGHRCD